MQLKRGNTQANICSWAYPFFTQKKPGFILVVKTGEEETMSWAYPFFTKNKIIKQGFTLVVKTGEEETDIFSWAYPFAATVWVLTSHVASY